MAYRSAEELLLNGKYMGKEFALSKLGAFDDLEFTAIEAASLTPSLPEVNLSTLSGQARSREIALIAAGIALGVAEAIGERVPEPRGWEGSA